MRFVLISVMTLMVLALASCGGESNAASSLVAAGVRATVEALPAATATPAPTASAVPSPIATPQPIATPSLSPTVAPTVVPSSVPAPGMPEMEIDSVRSGPSGIFVLLKEKRGSRYLPIGIGPAEATAMAIKLEQIPVSRPQTHDLLDSMIGHLGGRVIHVVITDLIEDTFYAKIVLTKDGETLEVDSRPSDAIALSLRAQVPIYADESVLKSASFRVDEY